MCVIDRHDMTLAVIVALNPNTTNNTFILTVGSSNHWKTLRGLEKLRLGSNFSFSLDVFIFNLLTIKLSSIFTTSKIVVCKLFQLKTVQNLSPDN